MLFTLQNVLAAVVTVAIGAFVRQLVVDRKYPSAPGPFLAQWTNLWWFFKVWRGHAETWNIEQHALHGKVIRVAPNKYSIDDPDACKLIYGISSPMRKTEWYTPASDPAVGANDNIFSVQDPNIHAGMRRKQASLYSMTTIKSYEPYVDECVSAFVKQFDRVARAQDVVDLQVWLQSYAFDVISQITYGVRHGFIDAGAKDPKGILHRIWHVQTMCTTFGLNMLLGVPMVVFTMGLPIFAMLKFVADRKKGAEEYSANRIYDSKDESAPATFYEKVRHVEETSPEDYKKYRVFVSLQQNVLAGSDTTSIALVSFLYNSLSNPRIWSKLHTEMQDAIEAGLISTPITFSESQKHLPYFNLVVKEALRIHPSVGLPMWRLIPAGGTTLCGIYFPEGTWVGINPWVASYNKAVFGEDAHEFRPERWDPAVVAKEKLAEMESYFLTFGAGTRSCIGRHISILEMGKLIPELVRRYNLTLQYKGEKKLKTENNWFVKQVDVLAKVQTVEPL